MSESSADSQKDTNRCRIKDKLEYEPDRLKQNPLSDNYFVEDVHHWSS